jgi:hypothetical protein
MRILKRDYRMRGFALLWLIPAALLVSAAPASAASKDSSKKAQEREAKKACLAGDPARGVEVLAELYVDTNDITYIFNQGRCFEQNRRYEDAIGRFREYLTKGEGHLSDDEKASARKHIETCESYLPKAEPHSPLVPDPVSVAPIGQTPPRADLAPEPSAAVVVATEAQPSRKGAGSGLRIAGIVVGSLGVVALGTGVALNLKVNSMAKDLEKTDNFNRDTDSTRKDYKTLGWIGYGAGAALLAGGSLLYFLGWHASHGSSEPSVALVPTLAPGAAGAVLEGVF